MAWAAHAVPAQAPRLEEIRVLLPGWLLDRNGEPACRSVHGSIPQYKRQALVRRVFFGNRRTGAGKAGRRGAGRWRTMRRAVTAVAGLRQSGWPCRCPLWEQPTMRVEEGAVRGTGRPHVARENPPRRRGSFPRLRKSNRSGRDLSGRRDARHSGARTTSTSDRHRKEVAKEGGPKASLHADASLTGRPCKSRSRPCRWRSAGW